MKAIGAASSSGSRRFRSEALGGADRVNRQVLRRLLVERRVFLEPCDVACEVRARRERHLVASSAKSATRYRARCLDGYETTISDVIPDDAKDSRFFEPFRRPRPGSVDAREFAAFADEAASIIEGTAPAHQKHLDWYLSAYRPACLDEVGVSVQRNGAEFCAFRIRQTMATELGAAAIHRLGLAEVERIRAEMAEIAADAGFAMRDAFIAELRTSSKYYAETPESLMQATARELKRIDGPLPTLFRRLPRLPYGIREIPAEIAPGTALTDANIEGEVNR